MVINTDLTKLLVGHEGKWVALSADNRKIVGVADSPKGALKQAHANKEKNPVLTRVPKTYDSLILIQ